MRFRSSVLCLITRSVHHRVLAADLVPRQDVQTIPAPIVLAASQDWDGNDGPWSSFTVQIGTPFQTMKVFVSTAAYQISVIVPQGCTDSDPPNCEKLRGGHLFNISVSSSWVNNTANLSSNIYPFGVDTALGHNARAELGFDDVTLGWQGAGGPALKNQTVAGLAAKDSYLGLLGLAPRASNFTSFDNPIPSYMQNLRNKSMIPSTSWAYTAGNQYRFNQVLGNLVLGGYDRSRFVNNGVSWSFSSVDIRDLTVQINSITVSDNSTSSSLLPTAIPAFLDSSLPYIWLPVESCTLFEKSFGLTWDTDSQLYLVNDSLHNALLSRNASIMFTLGNLKGGSVNITLPYAAFDLTVLSPLVTNATRYFPLKRAANSTQYTLGRTFFQEAYVIADYERGNFSVSQCSWVPDSKEDIVSILPPASLSTPGSPNSNSTSTSHGARIGAAVGGGVGGLLILLLLALIVYFSCVRPRRKAAAAELSATSAAAAADLAFFKPELETKEVHPIQEMEGKRDQLAVEADSNPAQIFELPAREDVAAELRGHTDAIEMAVPVPELTGQEIRPRWSWATSPAGATLNDEVGAVSPETGPSSGASPQSLRAQLARLPE